MLVFGGISGVAALVGLLLGAWRLTGHLQVISYGADDRLNAFTCAVVPSALGAAAVAICGGTATSRLEYVAAPSARVRSRLVRAVPLLAMNALASIVGWLPLGPDYVTVALRNFAVAFAVASLFRLVVRDERSTLGAFALVLTGLVSGSRSEDSLFGLVYSAADSQNDLTMWAVGSVVALSALSAEAIISPLRGVSLE